MGAWGPGLYSNDFALDLRRLISAVSRLPVDGPRLVQLLCDLEPSSQATNDEDYTTFWLVAADQLHRRGIRTEASDRALTIIADGSDLAVVEALGMSSADLVKRGRNLEKLQATLSSPPPASRRRTLKKPQALLMEPGQVYVHPVDSGGNCVNPYFTDATRPEFRQTRWGAFQVTNAGHALGYLAWYELARPRRLAKRKPTLTRALAIIDPEKRGIGTLTKLHAARMQLELLGSSEPNPGPGPGDTATLRTAAADISIANLLSLWAGPGRYR